MILHWIIKLLLDKSITAIHGNLLMLQLTSFLTQNSVHITLSRNSKPSCKIKLSRVAPLTPKPNVHKALHTEGVDPPHIYIYIYIYIYIK